MEVSNWSLPIHMSSVRVSDSCIDFAISHQIYKIYISLTSGLSQNLMVFKHFPNYILSFTIKQKVRTNFGGNIWHAMVQLVMTFFNCF